MRTSPTAMIAWEVLFVRRLALIGLPLALLLCALTPGMISIAPASRSVWADFFSFILVIAMLLAFGVFNFTQLDRRTYQAGFPNRLFILPVSTWKLVTTPMLCGAIAVAMLYAGWCQLVLRPLGRTLPVAWPALVLAVSMACYQTILWTLASMRITRIIALCAIGVILFLLGLLPMAAKEFRWPVLQWLMYGGVVGIGASAYVTALVAVDRQRHSAGHGSGLRFVIERLANAMPARTRPFRNAAHAQFWFELRRNGLLLPASVLLVMLVIPIPALFIGRLTPSATQLSFFWMCGSPIALAAVVGKVFVRPDAWTFDLGIPTLVSTRPIVAADYLGAKLKAAAVSTIATWAIVLTISPISLHLFHDTTNLWKTWNHLHEVFPGAWMWLMTALTLLSIVLFTWKLMIKSVWLALRGPAWFYVSGVFAELIVTVTIIIVIADHMDRDGPPSWWLFRLVPMLASCAAIALAIKLALALVAWRRSETRGHIASRHAVATFLLWLAGTSCITAALYLYFARYPLIFGIATAPWLRGLGALIGLLLLPLVRLAIAPAQFVSNRHR